jgi:hypothetical protein
MTDTGFSVADKWRSKAGEHFQAKQLPVRVKKMQKKQKPRAFFRVPGIEKMP